MESTWKLDSPILANTLRRVIYQSIPHYAFDDVDIKTNTTAYNSDHLRLKISMIPVIGIENTRALYLDFLSGASIMEEVLTMSCDVTHDDNSLSSEYLRLTTSHFAFTINGKTVSNPYAERPMMLCRLRYGDSIRFIAKTKYDYPSVHPRFSAATICYFKKNKDQYTFSIEPRYGITAEEVLWRAKDTIIRHLQLLTQKVVENNEIVFENDQYTFPNLVTFFLQDHPHVSYAGNRCLHQLEKRSIVYYNLQSSDIGKVLSDIVVKIRQQFESLV